MPPCVLVEIVFASTVRRRATGTDASGHQLTETLSRVYNPTVSRLPSAGVSVVSPSNVYRVLKAAGRPAPRTGTPSRKGDRGPRARRSDYTEASSTRSGRVGRSDRRAKRCGPPDTEDIWERGVGFVPCGGPSRRQIRWQADLVPGILLGRQYHGPKGMWSSSGAQDFPGSEGRQRRRAAEQMSAGLERPWPPARHVGDRLSPSSALAAQAQPGSRRGVTNALLHA